MNGEPVPVSPSLDFAPLALSADDDLPADIVLLLVYHRLPPDVAEGLAAGLRIFPHLTGRIVEGDPPVLVPDPARVIRLETAASDEAMLPEDFSKLPFDELSARFAPNGRDGSLFSAKRVDFPRTGTATLCLRISHRVVDGTGLGLFLAHATAASRGGAAPPVIHDRAALAPPSAPPHGVPAGYLECPDGLAPAPDVLAAGTPLWFAVRVTGAANMPGAEGGISSMRNHLAAWLCCETARIHPAFRQVAVWCGTRGNGGAPHTYTGNAGCYLHLDISGDDALLARSIQSLASRSGLARARETHRDVLGLLAAGRAVRWCGPRDDLLQLNLLSPPVEVADFGAGRPAFALLLARNSSGLRISPGVCGTRFLIEATLPPGVAAALAKAGAERGLDIDVWGGGLAG